MRITCLYSFVTLAFWTEVDMLHDYNVWPNLHGAYVSNGPILLIYQLMWLLWIKRQDSEIFLLVSLHDVIVVELLSKQIFPVVSARNFDAQLFIFGESDWSESNISVLYFVF